MSAAEQRPPAQPPPLPPAFSPMPAATPTATPAPALTAAIRTVGPPVSAAALLICLLTCWVVSGGFGTVAQVRLDVVGATVPVPATPGLTAAYFTVRNSGDQSDELISVRTADAAQSMLIENPTGGASGRMTPIQGVDIPAHGSATFGPFGDDIMLTGVPQLKVGQTVTLVLTFRDVGDVTVQATVTPPGTP